MTCSGMSTGHIYKIEITMPLNGASNGIAYKFEATKCVGY